MNELLSKIADEWERNLLAGVALVSLALGGIYAYELLNPVEPEADRVKERQPLPRYFDVSRLDGPGVAAMADGVNPMCCEFIKPEPPPKKDKPWQKPVARVDRVAPKVQEPAKPKAQEAAKPKAAPKAQEAAKPKPKPKPPRVVELRYIGNMSISGGSSAAQLYVSEVVSSKQRNSFRVRLAEKAKILGGLLVVKSFDKEGVVVTYSGGKDVKVPLGKPKATVVKIPQE